MDILPEAWRTIFAPESALLEHVARGTALYWALLILLRLMPRRTAGELAAMDLVFVFLIAEAAAHAMGEYRSVTDAVILIIVMMAWDYAVNALSYRAPFFDRLISPKPLEVVRDGKLLRRNMRREFLTEEELMSYFRKEGIDDLGDVKRAMIEKDGRISAVRKSGRE